MRKQRLQHRIKLDSLKIERIMSEHNFDAKVVTGRAKEQNGELSLQFDVASTVQEGVNRVRALKEDLLKTFSPKTLSIETDGHGRLQVAYRPQTEGVVSLLDLLKYVPSKSEMTAILGWTAGRQPVCLDFLDSETFHLAVFGGRRSGKTHLLRSIVLSLALYNRPAKLQLITAGNPYRGDDEHAGLKPLSYLPHMAFPFIETAAELAEGLAFLAAEIDYRQQGQITAPQIFLIIDDLTLLLHGARLDEREKLLHIARYGQETGVHLLFSAADPENPLLYDLMDAFIPSRIVGRLDTPYQAEIATNALESGAEQLLGRGEHLAAVGDSLTAFQAAMVADSDLKACLNALYHARKPRVLAHPLADPAPLPDDPLDEEGAEVVIEYGLEPSEGSAIDEDNHSAEEVIEPVVLRPSSRSVNRPSNSVDSSEPDEDIPPAVILAGFAQDEMVEAEPSAEAENWANEFETEPEEESDQEEGHFVNVQSVTAEPADDESDFEDDLDDEPDKAEEADPQEGLFEPAYFIEETDQISEDQLQESEDQEQENGVGPADELPIDYEGHGGEPDQPFEDQEEAGLTAEGEGDPWLVGLLDEPEESDHQLQVVHPSEQGAWAEFFDVQPIAQTVVTPIDSSTNNIDDDDLENENRQGHADPLDFRETMAKKLRRFVNETPGDDASTSSKDLVDGKSLEEAIFPQKKKGIAVAETGSKVEEQESGGEEVVELEYSPIEEEYYDDDF